MWKAVNKVLNGDTNSVGVSRLNIEGRTLTKEKDIAEALIIIIIIIIISIFTQGNLFKT